MPGWVMWTAAAALAVCPFLLAWLFNRGNRADSRGRRLNRRWHH